ncbi:uncharacterized protein LOC114332596 [Diabrotica virgifera virgifera]|uniref:Uncharacterized protein LOC114332596 n=1 Tax=Diabrotica virgifera virgifera TaxID=50390 RepID=A0A6P7FPE1_DIAVI|nr:uncharacterized protein LOC114332596 [Diabrotica virgifera virgifera]
MKHVIATILLCLPWLSYGMINRKDFSENQLERIDSIHQICKHTTGVSETLINQMIKGGFPEDLKAKRYSYCLWMVYMEMDDNLDLDVKHMWNFLPHIHKRDVHIYMQCNDEIKKLPGNDLVEKMWQMQKCAQGRVDPEHYLFF